MSLADANAIFEGFLSARQARHGDLRMEATEAAPADAPPADEPPAQEPKGEQPAKPETDWKAEARKWEQRAKEYKPAADKLAEIEEANKSEAQKAAERIAAAEQAAAAAEARALRREIALEHRLGKDDAALLDGMTDEDAMRRLAERLAKAATEDEAPVGFRVDQSGRKSGAAPDKDAAARAVFGI